MVSIQSILDSVIYKKSIDPAILQMRRDGFIDFYFSRSGFERWSRIFVLMGKTQYLPIIPYFSFGNSYLYLNVPADWFTMFLLENLIFLSITSDFFELDLQIRVNSL